MLTKRSSGILLHPTSLPGPFGIGDLGKEAYQWIDFLHDSGCCFWQILPLGPTGYGDSPYQCFSAHAGNPYLISLEFLAESGLLDHQDLVNLPSFPGVRVDYGWVIQWKLSILQNAFDKYYQQAFPELKEEMSHFYSEEENWLHDFALFMTIKNSQNGNPWNKWPDAFRFRDRDTLQRFENDHVRELQQTIFQQFLFFKQWKNLRDYANQKGIKIIGDIPIYVAYDSADCWSHPELFEFDQNRLPTVVGGTPPDIYSGTGQRWGNPIFRWSEHEKTGYQWWIERIRKNLEMVDSARLDHFRGFSGYWEIPATDATAANGIWKDGPGIKFLLAIRNTFGHLPIIAEDLGQITEDVYVLRDMFELPGMKILQFGFFGSFENEFLPHNYRENFIAYTGNHDNDTAHGWLESTSSQARNNCLKYLNSNGKEIAWDMIRSIWGSVAVIVIAPLQDFLSLGNEARMNFPGRSEGNWTWRVRKEQINTGLSARIRDINEIFGRLL